MSRKGADVHLTPAEELQTRRSDPVGDRGYLQRQGVEGLHFHLEIGTRVVLIVAAVFANLVLNVLELFFVK